MTWDYAHTAAARVNRVAKATRLADRIEDDLGRLPTEQERRMIARAAGVRFASDETWAMACEIYLERRAAS